MPREVLSKNPSTEPYWLTAAFTIRLPTLSSSVSDGGLFPAPSRRAFQSWVTRSEGARNKPPLTSHDKPRSREATRFASPSFSHMPPRDRDLTPLAAAPALRAASSLPARAKTSSFAEAITFSSSKNRAVTGAVSVSHRQSGIPLFKTARRAWASFAYISSRSCTHRGTPTVCAFQRRAAAACGSSVTYFLYVRSSLSPSASTTGSPSARASSAETAGPTKTFAYPVLPLTSS